MQRSVNITQQRSDFDEAYSPLISCKGFETSMSKCKDIIKEFQLTQDQTKIYELERRIHALVEHFFPQARGCPILS